MNRYNTIVVGVALLLAAQQTPTALAQVHSQHYAPNAGAAASQAVLPSNARIARVNAAGEYATVLLRGGIMEASELRVPILLKHFSFGWQALELVDSSCTLEHLAIGTRAKRALMHGMPKPARDRTCDDLRDSGDPLAIETIRKKMLGALIPYVVVRTGFAVAGWYGGGGGDVLFKRSGSHWQWAAGGGGSMGTQEMQANGVREKIGLHLASPTPPRTPPLAPNH